MRALGMGTYGKFLGVEISDCLVLKFNWLSTLYDVHLVLHYIYCIVYMFFRKYYYELVFKYWRQCRILPSHE